MRGRLLEIASEAEGHLTPAAGAAGAVVGERSVDVAAGRPDRVPVELVEQIVRATAPAPTCCLPVPS